MKVALGVDISGRLCGFRPTQVGGGPLLWLPGYAVSGNPISQWTDKSKSANHATGAGAARPTPSTLNGKPSVLFDGVANVLACATNITTGSATYFVVASQVTTSAAYKCIFSTQKHTLYARRAAADIWGPYYNPDIPSGVQLTTTAAVLEVCTRNFNDVDVVHNGAQITSTAGGLYGANSTSIGAVAGTFFGNVNIAEIIFYGSVLSAADRARVRRYLGTKYHITVL